MTNNGDISVSALCDSALDGGGDVNGRPVELIDKSEAITLEHSLRRTGGVHQEIRNAL